MKKLLVIGAGLGGLAGAHWARKAGYVVEIVEASDRPGGRARYIEHDGRRAAVGAQYLHNSYSHARELIEAVGLADQRYRISKAITVMRPEGPFELTSKLGVRHLLGLGGRASAAYFGARYAARGASYPVHDYSADIPDLDNRLLSDVTANLDERFYRYVILPAGYGFCQALPTHTSLLHGIRLMHMSQSSEFALPGGTVALAEALAERLPVEYGTPAKHLIVERGRVAGALLEDGTVRRADHVLVAVPGRAASALMPDELPELRRPLADAPFVPIVVPTFFLDRPHESEVPAYWDPDEERSFGMVIRQQEPPPGGRAIFILLSAYPRTLELIGQPDETLLKLGIEQLQRVVPGFQPHWVTHAEIARYPWGVGRFPPGQYQRNWELKCLVERQPGLSLADVCGTHIEATLRMARAGVERE